MARSEQPPGLRTVQVRREAFLIDFLAEASGESKRAAKRMLDTRSVFVNGQRVWMARHPLKPGDRVDIAAQASAATSADEPLHILQSIGAWLVIDKPAGLLSTGPASVETRLRREQQDPGIVAVHRLDRDTTGCLLLARGEPARAAAVEAFRKGTVEKRYEAIVAGRVSPRLSEIRTPIEGKSAVTRITILRAGAEASHLTIRILTGRTHQIRLHLFGAGHPVLGDRTYGTGRPLPDRLRTIPRPLLHAAALSLPVPGSDGGGLIRATAPLPEDFKTWLARMGLKKA